MSRAEHCFKHLASLLRNKRKKLTTKVGLGNMAKKSMIARDAKRLKTVQRFAVKRAALKATISSVHSSDEERREAMDKLKKLPRDASPSRIRNRCAITGRPRGVYSKFGLGRNKLREQTMEGNIPGLRKASW